MNHVSNANEPAPVNRKTLLISRSVRAALYVLIEAVILFYAAGRLDWIMGWLYLISYSIYLFLSQWIAPVNLEQPAGKRAIWEIFLVFVYRMTHPVIMVLAGSEFNSTQQQFPIGLVFQMIFLLFLLVIFVLMLWVEKINPQYYTHVVAEAKWEQEIIKTGPYEFIRHPGYLGMFMLALARPLVLGSFSGLTPGILGAIVIILLTAVEDRTLQANLAGYKSYAQSVKYRLFEGIW